MDVRIICATHQDLEARMKAGEFREDLFYRISEVSINIPPLRERSGDAVLLVKHFLEIYKSAKGKPLRLSEGGAQNSLSPAGTCELAEPDRRGQASHEH